MLMEKKLRIALFAKMFAGFIVSFLIGYFAKLPYSYTAGVIAVLQLWYSRDGVVKSALTRLFASFIGLALSALLFFVFKYTIWNLFLVVLTVLIALYLLKLEFGATIALVLIGQQWAEQTAWAPLNALLIMIIGTVPALILNYFTFKKSTLLVDAQNKLDQEIALIFTYFAKEEDYDFTIVKNILTTTRNNVQIALENYAINNINQIMDYINMRREQVSILEEISTSLRSEKNTPFKEEIINYLTSFSTQIGQDDFATALLSEHDLLLEHYRALPLPSSREEFEHRALLFATLNDIKRFLNLKIAYHQKYSSISKKAPHSK